MGPWFSAGIRSGFGAGFVAGLPRRGREKPAGLWKGSVGADGASPAAILSTELQLNRLRVWGGGCDVKEGKWRLLGVGWWLWV